MVRLTLFLLMLASPALGHDHARPDLDAWYESLKVPSDGLALMKGNGCCHKNDCKQRAFTPVGPGLFTVEDEVTGKTVLFTEQMRITDPEVLANNPYFQVTTCIYMGQPVCWTPGQSGG